MQINRDSPVPMWHQIELALAQDIRTGALSAGARVPAEAEVAARFGVHRHTARRALATLAEKGAVKIRRGLGTFVEDTVIDYPISARTRFTANLQQQNRLASHELLDAADQPAPGFVADALELPADAVVTALNTLGRADGVPISVGTNYFPAARFPGLADTYRELRSITAVLERFGLADYLRKSTRIVAALPTEREASLLRQPKRDPILSVDSVDVDPAGLPISFSRVRFAGERVQLLVG
ncbi:phosphonate metabolism transcriptional regulator PhnF [Acidisphaera sp. L21]|uniref:phosphonate metabolism transcriptional regulator PhnF n=1 Tax=Acidisphaera sp. L21 TaxID=1641851 RepID=UPI00131BAE64|nr:phosphonate metabolism transcriptional regulator PhnF [Acidisphaera sp. L21]